jgi:hypothetical protein
VRVAPTTPGSGACCGQSDRNSSPTRWGQVSSEHAQLLERVSRAESAVPQAKEVCRFQPATRVIGELTTWRSCCRLRATVSWPQRLRRHRRGWMRSVSS